MKHRSSQILFAHWDDKRASRILPERGEIDPGGMRGALGDTFILAFNSLNQHPFRLAGTRVCALFGRELKGSPFTALWEGTARQAVGEFIKAAADDSVGLVAAVTGHSQDGRTLDLELVLLPLRHCGQTHLRMIGTLAPLAMPYWAGSNTLETLSLGDHRYLGHRVGGLAPGLPQIADAAPRVRRGLMVYDGGQA